MLLARSNYQVSNQTLLHRIYPWIAWGLAAGLFFSEYFIRVSPSVMLPELMQEFHLNAFTLGSLSAWFYYPYVVMQIPVGMLVDRYGPKRLLTVTAFLFALGCLLFSRATSVDQLEIARFFMGFTASFVFVGAIKLGTIWFPSSRIGLIAGLTQALGMFGAAVGDAPTAIIVKNIGWRDTLLLMSVVFFIFSFLIGVIVRDKSKNNRKLKKEKASGSESSIGLLWSIKTVVKNKHSWLNALFVSCLYMPTAAFAEFWGVNFLHVVYHLKTSEAAFGISLIFIGWGVGGPIVGWLSDYLGRRKPIMITSAVGCLILMLMILYIPYFSITTRFILLFIFGVFNTGVGVSYALATEINPHKIAGTSLAFANMSSVIIGALFQPMIGYLMDVHVFHELGSTMHKIGQLYTVSDYYFALSVIPICLFVGVIASLFVKETYCKNIAD